MKSEIVFKAMADGTRCRILQMVTRHELSVSELVECLRLPQSTVSRHLKVLRDASLILDRREGTAVMYSAHENGGSAASGLQSHLLEWVSDQEAPRQLLNRLDRVLARRKSRSTDFFSRISHRWDQMRIDAFGDAFHLEALTAMLPAKWEVADIGTGTGFLLPLLSRTFRRVVAVDPVPEMLEAARARCAERNIKNVTFRKGDLSRLSLPDGRFDLVLAVLVIHHVPSPIEALRELHRIVKRGGKLLVVEQQAHNLEDFHDRMQDRWWGFEPAMLSRQVSEAGFRRVRHRELSPDFNAGKPTDGPDLFLLTAEK